ncbi:MAG TPA: hypothetical protein VHY91_11945 [Pirellulales bacterium]|jgi:hypothetical protein|nr:hypothetical protein [Pirellulales bacterium]
MDSWRVGLSAWIIQDGNYGDFRCNQRTDFALEFYPQECRVTSRSEKRAKLIEGCTYFVVAEVVRASDSDWVIDFGIRAYEQARPPAMIRSGCWIEAVIYLGVDPFFYFEVLAKSSEMPPLIYPWDVKAIGIETAPYIETRDANGRRISIRDKDKSAFRTIEQTDAWNDDGGNAEYVLDCELADSPPTRSRRNEQF